MASQNEPGEELPLRRKRARYRAWHRGTREMDLMLGPFADARLEAMEAAELGRFEQLLEIVDTDLQAWLIGQDQPPADADHALLEAVRAHSIPTTRA
jgi:antitoxin CptB